MSLRSLLLILGLLCLVAGAGLSVLWLGQDEPKVSVAEEKKDIGTAILVTTRAIGAGAAILQSDMGWKDVPSVATSGALVRGQISETEFLGAVTRRSFAKDEALTSDDLVKTTDRTFLAALLGPGKRAVAVPVEAQQSASGLVLPGDRVDVILTHILLETPGNLSESVAETILRDVRVIAVDQSLSPAKPSSAEGLVLADSRMQRGVTLEVDDQQVQTLVVGLQLGKLQLSLRALQSAPQTGAQRELRPTFPSDISPALRELALRSRRMQPSASSVESSVRRPPIILN